MPRLMPRSGTSTAITAWAARRNVPSPPSTTSTSVAGQLRARAPRCRRPAAAHCSTPRIRHQPGGPLAAARSPARWWGCRRTRCRPIAHAARSAPRRPRPPPRSARPTSAHDGPACEVDEELAVALRALDRRRDHVARARGRARPRPPRSPRGPGGGRRGSRTTPPFASARPASNCGLTRATIGPAAVAQHRADRAEDEAERDERDVDDGEVRGLRQGAAARASAR